MLYHVQFWQKVDTVLSATDVTERNSIMDIVSLIWIEIKNEQWYSPLCSGEGISTIHKVMLSLFSIALSQAASDEKHFYLQLAKSFILVKHHRQ